MRLRFLSLVALAALCCAANAAPTTGLRDERRISVAFVLLSEARLPNGEEIARAFARFAPKGESLRVGGTKTEGKPAVLRFDVSPHGTAIVALMRVPVPKREADDSARYSLSSLTTGWKLGPHKAHLIVTLRGSDADTRLETLNRLTALVAAVTESSPAIGVYWGAAHATHDPKFFVSAAAKPATVLRLTLWTGVSVAAEGDSRISLVSVGMEQLGLPDLMLSARKAEMGDALATYFDLLGYVADHGKPIPDGDTVGRSASERLPVHYVASPVKPGDRVWRVDLP